MLFFVNDYGEGAHEKILARLTETNRVPAPGYGTDDFCAAAREKIRAACKAPNADVYFISGGTQTNQLVIDSLIRSYEGVLSAVSGHVNCHEAGAIEYTGHKVLPLPMHLGKIDANELRQWVEDFYANPSHMHTVYPGMVYISHPTEYGTLYTKQELTAISKVCREKGLPLFMDGARLGYGLMSPESDMTLSDIAALCDVFYIGGTKIGALCGEAVVFPQGNAPAHLTTLIKQHGALLAKGRLMGIQFDVLFTDNLYFEISRHAIEMARRVKSIFQQKGYPFLIDSPTNQQFVVLKNEQMEKLAKEAAFDIWEKVDDTHTAVRFATSWATPLESVEQLEKILPENTKEE